jgi:hypothetical protein
MEKSLTNKEVKFMDNQVEIAITIKETFDSLYKLGYFLVDLNSICNFSEKINRQSIEDAKKEKKYRFGITSRFLNKDSLDIIKLTEFKQGSFFALIVAPIIVGIVLMIISKYINQELYENKVEINISNVTVNNFIINTYSDNKSLEKNIDDIMQKLKDENLINQNSIIYDKAGKKILLNNIERIKGQLVNKNW